jgi:hypothetical protein
MMQCMASCECQRMQCTSMIFRLGKQVWLISCKCLGEVVAYIYPKLVEERLRKFAPPSDEECFDTAVEYCERRLLKFRKQFYIAGCHFIQDEDQWRTAIRYHNKFTWAFENFFEHVRIRYGFEGKKDTGFRQSKILKAVRESPAGHKVVHQWTEEAVQLVRPNIKALESFKH